MNAEILSMVTLAQCAKLTVKPSRVVNAARGKVGHAILWAMVKAQADVLKLDARRAGGK